MMFASDNWAGAAPEVSDSIARHAAGSSPAYGESELDRSLERRFNELFEREVAVFFVGTGTAANSLSLTALNRPGGMVFCHRQAHLVEDECGAPEFLTGGARMAPIAGDLGKMHSDSLESAIRRYDPSFVHHGQPMAISVTQSTELGTSYSLSELQQIGSIARDHELPLHMDGARFANALVRLDASPADMTWRAGVDVVCFGGTKNGCWCAEAIVFFHPQHASQLPFIRKRAAQLFSKSRFIAAQFHAYLDDDLWLRLARHANTMADRLVDLIEASPRARLAWPCQSNEVFVTMAESDAAALAESGAKFYPWPRPDADALSLPNGWGLYRLVTSFATTPGEVDQFGALIQAHSVSDPA
ncbi:MAG: low specificity L-threonine aldolase [Planctomycetota bacterium]